jgi:L-2-hydroxyglutarate oxidase LhgO
MPEIKERFLETDVLIIGAGGAGLPLSPKIWVSEFWLFRREASPLGVRLL